MPCRRHMAWGRGIKQLRRFKADLREYDRPTNGRSVPNHDSDLAHEDSPWLMCVTPTARSAQHEIIAQLLRCVPTSPLQNFLHCAAGPLIGAALPPLSSESTVFARREVLREDFSPTGSAAQAWEEDGVDLDINEFALVTAGAAAALRGCGAWAADGGATVHICAVDTRRSGAGAEGDPKKNHAERGDVADAVDCQRLSGEAITALSGPGCLVEQCGYGVRRRGRGDRSGKGSLVSQSNITGSFNVDRLAVPTPQSNKDSM